MAETIQTVVSVDGPVRSVRVQSASRPGESHRVMFACDCEGFRFVGYCHHLIEAAVVLREDARAQRSRTRYRLAR